jgi:site-specific recombinase XerD
LEPYVAGFAEVLLGQGYARGSAEQYLCFVAHLDRWMQAEGVAPTGLSRSVVQRFLAARRSAGYRQYLSMQAVTPLRDYLTSVGAGPVGECVAPDPVEELLDRYRRYLLVERGLTVGTVRGYVDCVRPFVATRLRGGVLDLVGINAAAVNGFVVASCAGRAVGSAKLIVCSLRSVLRWLHVSGQLPVPLAAAVPPVAGWRLSSLPKGLTPAEVDRLLTSCDRRTPTGRRDFAVLLLLSRLGLRAGEVARLGLDDIDWRRGEVTVTGKGNRAERLPLPADVGAAIVAYLRDGRPTGVEGRSVFVRVHAPLRALTSGGVTMIVFDAAQRAGLGKIHAHRLRHSAATALLRAGNSLPEVGQVLRHRSAVSTAIYAKVDRDALSVLARPWPTSIQGGVS